MRRIAVVGGGPAGLMAAEALSSRGLAVDLYDRMPSVGRKFLVAGRGGLNLTHGEPLEAFLSRYGPRRQVLEPMLRAFSPEDIRRWAHDLGVETFVGTSGRVFPRDMKAAPLLRHWIHELRARGVAFHPRHRLVGWSQGLLRFETPEGLREVQPAAAILAFGGGSWSRLGSDGAWVPTFESRGLRVAPLRPSNCGFEVAWSPHFRERFSGHPVKSVAATPGVPGWPRREGEFVVTSFGVEGSLVYAFSAPLRDEIEKTGSALLRLDLVPGRDLSRLQRDLAQGRGTRSMAEHLRRRLGLQGVKAGLARELLPPEDWKDPSLLAAGLKDVPLPLVSCRPLEEAISSAGGVDFQDLDHRLMLRAFPGVFCAGEMLDWEAPTGGYCLSACLATGRWAGVGAAEWLLGNPGK